jgi:rhamnulokinase
LTAAVDAYAAVDLGASSGRVMLGRVGPETLDLVEVNRFANRPVEVRGTLHWDVLELYRAVLKGVRIAGEQATRLTSIGVDSWAVDYGLLDAEGSLLGNPVHYRDGRMDGGRRPGTRLTPVGSVNDFPSSGLRSPTMVRIAAR